MRETSLEAYYKDIVPTLGKRQSAVFKELTKYPNATNSELAKSLGWTINTVTPRIFELREQGLVVEDEKRLCKITGRRAIAWRSVKPVLPEEDGQQMLIGM